MAAPIFQSPGRAKALLSAVLTGFTGAAEAALSLDPSLHIGRRYASAWIEAKPSGGLWDTIADYNTDGSLVHVVNIEEDWAGAASAYAEYGRYGASGVVDMRGDTYTYGAAYADLGSTDYMVLSPIVPGTTEITNIARYAFLLHGTVPSLWADEKSYIDDAFVDLVFKVRTGHGTFDFYERFEFEEPQGNFSSLISGSFTFDIDEVIKMETTMYLNALIRPRADLWPGTGSFADWENSQSVNGVINLDFSATAAWTELVLPEGIAVSATASGVSYPVAYAPPVPVPPALPLLGSALGLLWTWRRRTAGRKHR